MHIGFSIKGKCERIGNIFARIQAVIAQLMRLKNLEEKFMSSLLRRIALAVLMSAVAGCSTVKDSAQSVQNSVGGWFESGDNTLSTKTEKKTAGDRSGSAPRNAVTLRVAKYVDQRGLADPRLLGAVELSVRGLDGNQLVLDQEVATVVMKAIKKQFISEGYQVLEGISANKAMYEVSGVVKDLTLNVKLHDEIYIAVDTTMKELATGKVVWSGLVTEKDDRFAGISGNNKNDLVDYLNDKLHVVSHKTVESIGAMLLTSQPELFNLTPGMKPISGVSLHVTPNTAKAAPATPATPAPVTMAPPAPPATMAPGYGAQPGVTVPPPAHVPRSSATTGLLLINTNPPHAKVYQNGVYYGVSPLHLEMKPGIHTISVKLEGYKAATEKVSVRKGENTELELNLER